MDKVRKPCNPLLTVGSNKMGYLRICEMGAVTPKIEERQQSDTSAIEYRYLK
jgi:hypothetical protein